METSKGQSIYCILFVIYILVVILLKITSFCPTSAGDYVYHGNQMIMPNLYFPRGKIGLVVTIKNIAAQTTMTTLSVEVSL